MSRIALVGRRGGAVLLVSVATNMLEPSVDPAFDQHQERWGELRPSEPTVAPLAAGQIGNPGGPGNANHDDDGRSIAPIIVLGILLLGLTIALIVVRGNASPTDEQDVPQPTESIVIEEEEATDAAPPVDDAEDAAEEEVAEEPEATNPTGPFVEPAVTLTDETVTLTGGQPDQATADRIAGEVAAIVGADNVTNDFVIDTRAPADGQIGMLTSTDSLTYLEDSFRVTDASQRQLELTAYVLEQNPEAMLTITNHVASSGDPVADAEVSQTEADRLIVFFSERGIDPARVIALGLGSAVPVDADAAPDAIENRRSDLGISLP